MVGDSKDFFGMVVVSCCGKKLVTEVGDISGAQLAVGSHYQATASENTGS
jgi:hypothetical protein